MKNLKVITFLLLLAVAELATAQQQQPLLVKYRDDDGNIRMSFVKDSKWKQYEDDSDCANNSEQEDEKSEDVSAHLYEYARREGPNEDSGSANEMYNISDEEGFERFKGADVYNESDNNEETSDEKPKMKHPYANEYIEVDSSSAPEEKEQSEESEEQQEKRSNQKPHKKSAKKIVYVYKQPPIIVKPKPTNVYIRSKPILVQPPPLVVHHPQPKPCNPIIKYRPPNINLKPVIVKISKPKTTTTTTTTTTPCPTTTKRPCRKCRRKPSKKCGRCSRRKQVKSSRPKDMTFYYNQHHYRSSDPAQYVQYKNVKCADGFLT